MVKFLDGPAAGVVLILRRAPILLRVVQSRDGEWDALDQPEDTPKARETVHLYWRADATIGHAFTDGRTRGGGRRCGTVSAIATYRAFPNPPVDAILRDNAAWDAWCAASEARILDEWRRMLEGAGRA